MQALEAGGSKSTKGQIFSGTRDYFSGGAVASFALIDGRGAIACSGIAYGYRGQIRSDDFSYALQPTPTSIPAVVAGTNNALPNARANVPQCPRYPQIAVNTPALTSELMVMRSVASQIIGRLAERVYGVSSKTVPWKWAPPARRGRRART